MQEKEEGLQRSNRGKIESLKGISRTRQNI